MKITLKSVNCKGFLIIELVIALGILAILILLVHEYQLQVSLYRTAAQQLYKATTQCESIIEELWSGALAQEEQTIIKDQIKIDIRLQPGPNHAFKYVQVRATWMSVFKRLQKIKFDLICL